MELATQIVAPVDTAKEVLKSVTGTEIGDKGEKPIEPTPPAPPKPERFSPQFQALAKREKALVREREAIKAEKLAVEADRSKTAKLLEAQALASTNPLKALEAMGLTYKQITDFILNNEKTTPEMQANSLREELKSEFQKELEARDKKMEEDRAEMQKADAEKELAKFRDNAGKYLKANATQFPLINHPKNDFDYAIDTIAAMIEQHLEATTQKDDDGKIVTQGKLLTFNEAATFFENHLKDLAVSFADTIKGKSEPTKEESKDKPPVQETRTITNSMAGMSATTLPAKTEQDRINRALAALSR